MGSNTIINAQSELAEDAPPVPPSRWTAAIADLALGLYEWRIWWVLAASEIRQRYRRSTVGQLWFTLSMGVMIAGIGLVYSVIFRQAGIRLCSVPGRRSHRLEFALRPDQQSRHLLHFCGNTSASLSKPTLDDYLPDYRARLPRERTQLSDRTGAAHSL